MIQRKALRVENDGLSSNVHRRAIIQNPQKLTRTEWEQIVVHDAARPAGRNERRVLVAR